jgi:hypothetical protein
MQIVDVLKNKQLKVKEIPKWGPYLRKQWEINFADHLSHEEKKAISLYDDDGACGFLWHLFSYEKKEALKNELAEEAFNNELKGNCYVFYQHSDYALILEYATYFTANDLLKEKDIYVVDKEFNWTYVKTHETGWLGPYFSRKTSDW